MAKILVGADPELFLKNPNSGVFISAHNLVPGTKTNPFKVKDGAIQLDGTAAEFNIEPASTVYEFVSNINSVMQTLRGYVPGYNLTPEPVAVFEESYWRHGVPESAKTLGCDPDFNAWTEEQNPPPNAHGAPMRTAAGHVHIGWTDGADIYDTEHFRKAAKVARQMDYYLGIHSLIWDRDATRRQLYGKAGAFRVKPYGVEYRVLSNRWLVDDSLKAWVYESTIAGMDAAERGEWAEDTFEDLAQTIINNNITNWKEHYPALKIAVGKVAA